MDFSYHSVILLLGIAVAGLALFGAIAVGPYGRRGVRMMLATISFAAFLGSAFWFTIYLGFIEQRRGIETRLSELRAQVLSAGSPLACLERSGDAFEAACAQTLFATPETLAAANFYTAARLDLLTAAARYSGPRTPQFDDAIDGLRISLQQDPFGLTANILALRRGCTAERCDDIAIFRDPTRVRNNIRQKAFDAHVARHAGAWRTPTASATPATAPTGAETYAPIPEKYTLPSAASIPPVSIMNEEPAQRPESAPAPVKDRLNSTRQPVTASPREEQAPARREKMRPSGPLAINPPQ